MLFKLAERLDLAAEQPAKLNEVKALFGGWSVEVGVDCRRLGIERMRPESPTPANAKATPAR